MPSNKYRDEFVIQIFEMAQKGICDSHIAKALKVSWPTFRKWREEIDAVKDALVRGRVPKPKELPCPSFREYVYGRLPDDLKALWDEITNCTNENETEPLLLAAGIKARQHIFIYALTLHNFSTSAACRVANVSKWTLEHDWKKNPDFQELIAWINECKKDFFEAALVNLAKVGDTQAIIFANKTLNKDRGYSEKTELEITGDLNYSHRKVSLDDLGLTVAQKKELLAKVIAHNEVAK